MMQLLETGKALYVLAGLCLMGILTRGLTRRLYKGLLKESTNLTVTKNRTLKELKTRAENAYRVNQGMRDTGAWLEHQLNEMIYAERLERAGNAVDLAVSACRRNWRISRILVSSGYFLYGALWCGRNSAGNVDVGL